MPRGAGSEADWGVETQQVPSIVAVVLLATFPPFRHLLRKCHLPFVRGGERLYLVGKVVLSLLRRTCLSAPLVKGGWHGEAVTGGRKRSGPLYRYDSAFPTFPPFHRLRRSPMVYGGCAWIASNSPPDCSTLDKGRQEALRSL